MRSERQKGRSLLARLMVLMMIINLLSGINPSAVRADEQHFNNNGQEVNSANGIILKETASNYNNGEFDVEMLIKGSGSTQTENKNLDVVLVVDRSGSMKDYGRMKNAKKAAKEFVDNLLKDNGGNNVRVGLVSFAGNNGNNINPVLEPVSLQKDKNNLKKVIDKYQPYSGDKAGTFTQAALRKANELFENNNHKKIIVLVSDGEPTYAYGTENVLDFNQIEKANSNTPRDGYEIWSRSERKGKVWDDWKKGYDNSSYESWFKTYWWTPYYVKIVKTVPILIGNGREMTKAIKDNTINEAKAIKDSGVEVFSVGIGVKDEGTNVLKAIASPSRYYASNTYANDLDNILKELHNIIINYNIVNGSLEIKMNDKVNFKNNANLSDLIVSVVKKNYNAVSQEEKDSFDNRKAEIMNKKNWKWNVANKVLTLSNITLGEEEELTVTYKAELQEEWKDGNTYPISQTALLNLKSPNAVDNKTVNFTIPTVKDTKTVNIVINKRWIGDKVPEGVNELKFEVTPKTPTDNYSISVSKNNGWTGRLENLPKYNNGSIIEYKVEEPTGDNYKVEDIKRTESSDGVLTFEVTNKNTEKTSFTVRKDWANTPEELKFDVNVQLYADGEKIDGKTVTISNGNPEATFDGLDKYSPAGNEIKYTAKEVGEENHKLTNGNFNFEVSYEIVNGIYKITNKCTNPENATFDVTLTKIWEGWNGEPATEARFNFRDGKGNLVIPVTLNNADVVATQETDKTTWKKTIQLPKYYFDGTVASYNVTEENNNTGFTPENPNGASVDVNNTNPTFTNKRGLQKITVTKDWGVTPDEFIKDINVVLSGKVGNYEVKVTKTINKGETTVEFEVPTTTPDGAPIEYEATEEGVNNGIISIDGKEFKVTYPEKYKIVNTYTGLESDTIKLTINKVWAGEGRTSAEFEVKDETGNKAVENITLNEEPWSTTIELPKWDNVSGQLKKYTVNEVNLSKAFTSSSESKIENDKIEVTFTNTRVKRWLEVEKKWLGNPDTVANSQASFKLEYLGENSKIFSLPNNDGTLVQKFTLPVYDLTGNPIEYKVSETPVEGFVADATAHTVKLSELLQGETLETPKKIIFTNTELLKDKFTVHKTWQGIPAASVSFGLYDGTNKVDTLTLTATNAQAAANNVWTGKFEKDVPGYNSDNAETNYVVKELDANGHPVESGEVKLGERTYKVESSLAQDTPNTYNFINTDATRGDVEVTKIWKGRPRSQADFGLYKKVGSNLEPVPNMNETIDTTNSEKWIVKYVNLPYTEDNGSLINYVIKEIYYDDIVNNGDVVDLGGSNYKVSYDNEGNITNTELINITVKKVWDDSVPMTEQKSVEAAIFNGENEVDSVVLNEGNGWQHTFTNLPYLENGYTVKETAVNGAEVNDDLKKLYDIVVDKENIKETTDVTIKNSFKLPTPAEGQIKVVKQWMVNPDNKEVTVKVFKKTIGTPDEPSKWVETGELNKLSGGYVLETEFNMPEEAEDYYVLETAIDGTELTEDEIQTILNSNDLETVQYKIGEYDVLVKEPEDRVFFIKNSNDKELTELTVEKQWSEHTLERYVQPVKVQLYAETEGVLEAIGSSVELNSAKWKTKFKGLDKYDDNNNEIRYHIAEVAVADEFKNDIKLDDIQNGYTIGKYNVAIDGDGTDEVVITNDVNLVDITARKDWGTVSESNKKPVEFTLYSRMGAELKEVTSQTVTGEGGNWTAEFKDQPRVDENGEEFTYYVFETKIDGTAVGIDPLTGTGYTVDPFTQTILYTTGTINNGKYSVVISVNAVNDKEIVVKNSFMANPTDGPIIPPVPGFDPSPTPTPDTTPTVDVTDDTTPQGDANTDKANPDAGNTDADNTDDDGIVEIDEDETPEGDAKDGSDKSSPKDTTDIEEDETPQGKAGLPKTGGTAGDFYSIIGLGLIGLGFVFKKRKN